MKPIEPLETTLMSYRSLEEELRIRGKNKVWFDTGRLRHEMFHKPIVKPYSKFNASGKKGKHGRQVFYLRAILPYSDEVIELHDNEGLTYKEIKKRMKDKTDMLDSLRDADLNIDEHIEPEGFFLDFQIAKAKLGSFYGWGDNSQDMKLLNHVYKTRMEEGKRYFELIKKIQQLITEGNKTEVETLKAERDKIGDMLNYCRTIMFSTIQHCVDLKKNGKIDITEEDKEDARSAITGR